MRNDWTSAIWLSRKKKRMLADAELFGSLSEIAGSEGIEWIEKRWVGVGLLTRIQPRWSSKLWFFLLSSWPTTLALVKVSLTKCSFYLSSSSPFFLLSLNEIRAFEPFTYFYRGFPLVNLNGNLSFSRLTVFQHLQEERSKVGVNVNSQCNTGERTFGQGIYGWFWGSV